MLHRTAIALVSLALAVAAGAAQALKTLSAQDIRQQLIGRAITDGYHWTYHLKPDGTIDASETGRARTGRWHLEGNRLCFVIAHGAAPDECWDVMREGKSLALGINGQIIYDVKVLPPGR